MNKNNDKFPARVFRFGDVVFDDDGVAFWINSKGFPKAITNMSDSHILNTLNYLEVFLFSNHPGKYQTDWLEMFPLIDDELPAYRYLLREALRRETKWPSGGTGNLAGAFFVLKRKEDPPESFSEKMEQL